MRQKEDYNVVTQLPDFNDLTPHFTKLILQREHHKNILSVIQYINEWCVDINRDIAIWGTNFGAAAGFHIAAKVPNPGIPYDDVVSDEHLKFSFDTTGRARITCTDAFLSQYYLAINPEFAKIIGLPLIIWGGRTPGFDIPPQPEVEYVTIDQKLFLQAPVRFAWDIQYVTTQGSSTFVSTRSMFLMDERVTLAIELTIPSSRVIQSDDSVVTEKYRLAEFALDRFVDVICSVNIVEDQVESSITVSDKLEGGLTSLTDTELETHIIHMLPGAVQTINTRIFCNYRKWDKSLVSLPYLMDNALWDLDLLFCKKVT